MSMSGSASVVLCPGPEALVTAIRARFGEEHRLLEPRGGAAEFALDKGSGSVSSVLLPMFASTPDTPQAAANEAFVLVETIRVFRAILGGLPQHVVVLHAHADSENGRAGAAILRTLVSYTTAHLMFDPICVNLIRYPSSPQGVSRAADVAFALTSGLLDHMRGQALDLLDL